MRCRGALSCWGRWSAERRVTPRVRARPATLPATPAGPSSAPTARPRARGRDRKARSSPECRRRFRAGGNWESRMGLPLPIEFPPEREATHSPQGRPRYVAPRRTNKPQRPSLHPSLVWGIPRLLNSSRTCRAADQATVPEWLWCALSARCPWSFSALRPPSTCTPTVSPGRSTSVGSPATGRPSCRRRA